MNWVLAVDRRITIPKYGAISGVDSQWLVKVRAEKLPEFKSPETN